MLGEVKSSKTSKVALAARKRSRDMMKPKLFRQVRTDHITDDEERQKAINQRAFISKKNVSRFFTYLYQAMYGGKDSSRPLEGRLGNGNGYHFSPDILKVLDTGQKEYTEVKATSEVAINIVANAKQTANNLGEILMRFHAGEDPLRTLDYALFRYGTTSRKTKTSSLDNSELVKALSETRKRLMIVPANVFLFLTSLTEAYIRDQTTSWYGKNEQEFHNIRGRILTGLSRGEDLESLGKSKYSGLSSLLGLDQVEIEHTMTDLVIVNYRRVSSVVEPFAVTRYFIPKDKYPKIIKKMAKNHKDITEALGIVDIFQEYKDIPFDIPTKSQQRI